jgi:hypothetical protein
MCLIQWLIDEYSQIAVNLEDIHAKVIDGLKVANKWANKIFEMSYPWAFFGPRTRFAYNRIAKYTESQTIYLESTRCFGTVLPSGNMSQCVC